MLFLFAILDSVRRLGFRDFPAPFTLAMSPVRAVAPGAGHGKSIGNKGLGLHRPLGEWVQHARREQILFVDPEVLCNYLWRFSFDESVYAGFAGCARE